MKQLLDWFATLQEESRAHEALPEEEKSTREIAKHGRSIFGNWEVMLRGFGFNGQHCCGYPVLRERYFEATGQEPPNLNWPTNWRDSDDWWHGQPCDECGTRHPLETVCNPDAVSKWKSLPYCEECGNRKTETHRCGRKAFEVEEDEL